MSNPIVEADCRRPDFVPGAPVTLADGQVYFLRKPVVRFVPDDDTECGFQIRLTLAGDDRFPELMERRDKAMSAGESVPIGSIAGIELAIGKLLLLANYDLTPEQVGQLLQFGYDDEADPDGAAIRDEVMEVAAGRGKKSQDVGTG